MPMNYEVEYFNTASSEYARSYKASTKENALRMAEDTATDAYRVDVFEGTELIATWVNGERQ